MNEKVILVRLKANSMPKISFLKFTKQESFRGLKFYRSEHLMTPNFVCQIGGFKGPKVLKSGDNIFQVLKKQPEQLKIHFERSDWIVLGP